MKKNKIVTLQKHNISLDYLLIDILVGIALLSLAWFKGGIWFETNDDHFIMDMIIGQMTGKESCDVSVCSPLFTLPLSVLYGCVPRIPWYGLLFLLFHVISVSVPLHFVGKKCQKIYWHIILYIGTAFIFICSWYVQCRLQFTSTAELLATAGFLCVLFDDGKKKSLIWFAAFELLGYALRPEAMLLIQPIGFAVLIGIYLFRNKKVSENLKKLLNLLIISLSVIVLGLFVQKICFGGSEWKQINDINQARVELVDYMGCPEYQDVKDILDKYDVSEAEYNAFVHNMFPDYRKLGNSVIEIAEYTQNKTDHVVSISDVLKWVYWDSYKDIYHGLNKVALCSLFFAIAAIIGSGNIKGLITVALYYMAKGISWGYIFYNGRIVNRVNVPLYITEILFFLCIGLFYFFLSKDKESKKLKKIISKICLLFLLPLFFYSYCVGRDQNREFSVYTADYELLATSEKQITDYCNRNLDKHFVIANPIFGNWKRTVWDTCGGIDNYIYTGGWFSYSPKVVEWVDEYMACDELYLITTEESVQDNHKYENAYFDDVLNSILVESDRIELATGVNAVIYKVSSIIIIED